MRVTTKTTTTDRAPRDLPGGLLGVARSFPAPEAQLAAALPRAAGIRATLFDLNSHVMIPNRALALGGTRVMVPRADAPEALRLLAQVPQPPAGRSPWLAAVFIALICWCGAAPVPGGLFLRRPDPGQAAAL